jgi:antitoxin component YwqK of YwqJK toxin-antitoxin module
MFKQNILIICIILVGGFAAHAQTQYSYYFDNNINLVKKSRAVFEGVGVYENGLFELKVFDKKSKKLLILEHFTDSSLQLSNGLFVNFLPNGNKEWEGNYAIGKQDGLWGKWNGAGQVIDSSLFKNGTKITETAYNYYPSGKLLSDEVLAGKDSIVKYAYFDENGKELAPNSKEDPDKVFTKMEVKASFPGGDAEWQKYIKDKLGHAKAYGSCTVQFILKKDGTITDFKVINRTAEKITRIVKEAITDGPKWIPAKQNGRDVNSFKTVSITFERPQDSSFSHP